MIAAHVGASASSFAVGSFDGWLTLVHGRSSILFATLAGVSVGLLTGGAHPYTGVRGLQARMRVMTRSAGLLAAVGILALLNSSIVLILAYYAVWFALALFFVRWRAWALFTVGAVVAIGGPVALQYALDLISRLPAGGYSFGTSDGVVVQAMVGMYPGLMWMGFVLVGLGLSKLDLRRVATLVVVVIVGASFAVAGYLGAHLIGPGDGAGDFGWESGEGWPEGGSDSGWEPIEKPDGTRVYPDGMIEKPDGTTVMPSGALMKPDGTEVFPDGTIITPDYRGFAPDGRELTSNEIDAVYEKWYSGSGMVGDEWIFDTESPLPDLDVLRTADPHSSTPFEGAGSGGVAVAIIGLCCLAPVWLRRVLFPIGAVGALAFTIYSAHVILIHVLPQYFSGPDDNIPLLWMWGGAMVFASLWVLLIGRGPLEWALRALSIRSARLVPDPPTSSGPEVVPALASGPADPPAEPGAAQPADTNPWPMPNQQSVSPWGAPPAPQPESRPESPAASQQESQSPSEQELPWQSQSYDAYRPQPGPAQASEASPEVNHDSGQEPGPVHAEGEGGVVEPPRKKDGDADQV